MNIPLNWLKEYVALPNKQSELTDALTMAGHMLDKVSVIDEESILDLELRGNRADCYSIIGIAREVSALFNKKIRQPKLLQLGKTNTLKGFELKADATCVKRAGFIEINNVTIVKSPFWLSKRLKSCRIEPVNNIVDLTNYVMLELGEPMHAFDLDKVGKILQIRLAKEGEKITTFQGTSLTLTKDDLVWTKSDKVLSVAGAIGEKTNSISEGTKNVLLEAANYDRANIRRSVHRHNLYTEAGIRHEKDLDPNLVETALSRFLYLLKENKWGTFKPLFYDYYPNKVVPWNISFDIKRFCQHSGIVLTEKQVTEILKKLKFKVVKNLKNQLLVEVPTLRTDVTYEEDLYEEVLRIYGYDKIPPKTLSLEIPKNITPNFIKQEETFRSSAVAVGMNEMISLPFVPKDYSELNVNSEDTGHKVASLINPPSPDTQDMRQSLIPNLILNCQKTANERGDTAKIFEIGKVYTKFNGKYQELRKMGFAYWSKKEPSFPKFKGILEAFFQKAQIPIPKYESEVKMIPLSNSYNMFLDKSLVGFGGQYEEYFLAEIDLDSCLGKVKKYEIKMWPKFPPQIEDITFALPDKTKIGNVVDTIKETSPLIGELELKDVFENFYTFRVVYQSQNKTLENSEIEKIRNTIIKNLQKKFSASVK
jgi:phenylalanyl-tRNA synthetase beta chain